MIKLVFLGACVVGLTSAANATSYFVQRATVSNGTQTNADTATSLVKDRVKAEPDSTLATKEKDADFILKPKITALGDAYLLSIEKFQKKTRLSMTEGKAKSIEDLDKAAEKATHEAIAGKPEPGMAPAPRPDGGPEAKRMSPPPPAMAMGPKGERKPHPPTAPAEPHAEHETPPPVENP